MATFPTPRASRRCSLAGKEAKSLNHSYVGTEHLLLGLFREGEGVAARVLKNLGADYSKSRIAIVQELHPDLAPDSEEMRNLLNPPQNPSWWERLLKKLLSRIPR